MSLFNTKYPNAIETRVKNSYAENVYQWNFDNEEFERVGAGGGGGEIPYYCKTNSIKIDNIGNTSSTQVYDNSVDVVDTAANKSSSLLSDKLVLVDSSGNSELTKTTIAIANKLNQGMIEPVMNSNLPQYKLVAWDSTNNIFKRMDAIRIGSGVPAVSIMNNEFNMSGGVTFSIIRPNYLELKNGANLLTANSNVMKISNGSAPFQSLHYTHSDFIIGSATNASGAVLDVTKNRLKLTNNEISFFDQTTTTTTALNVNSFIAANKIRDIGASSIDSNSKMVLYNTANQAISHADIPAGVELPYYLQPNSVSLLSNDGGQALGIYPVDGGNSRISVSDVGGSGPAYCSLNAASLKFHPAGPTTSNDKEIRYDDVVTVNKLSTITSTNQNYREIVYEPGAKDFFYKNYGEQDILRFSPDASTFPGGLTLSGVINSAPYYTADLSILAPIVAYNVGSEVNYYPIQINNLKCGQWLKIDFTTYNIEAALTTTNPTAIYPLIFAEVGGNDAIFQAYCIDSRLDVKVFRCNYNHKGTVFQNTYAVSVKNNGTAGGTIYVKPKIFVRFLTKNEAPTGNATFSVISVPP